MIVINRDAEVYIEDGYTRIIVHRDGGGYIHHPDHDDVDIVDLHEPLYLEAAKNAGMEISDFDLERSREMVKERYV